MERKQLQFSADETVLMTEKLIDALVTADQAERLKQGQETETDRGDPERDM